MAVMDTDFGRYNLRRVVVVDLTAFVYWINRSVPGTTQVDVATQIDFIRWWWGAASYYSPGWTAFQAHHKFMAATQAVDGTGLRVAGARIFCNPGDPNNFPNPANVYQTKD